MLYSSCSSCTLSISYEYQIETCWVSWKEKHGRPARGLKASNLMDKNQKVNKLKPFGEKWVLSPMRLLAPEPCISGKLFVLSSLHWMMAFVPVYDAIFVACEQALYLVWETTKALLHYVRHIILKQENGVSVLAFNYFWNWFFSGFFTENTPNISSINVRIASIMTSLVHFVWAQYTEYDQLPYPG